MGKRQWKPVTIAELAAGAEGRVSCEKKPESQPTLMADANSLPTDQTEQQGAACLPECTNLSWQPGPMECATSPN